MITQLKALFAKFLLYVSHYFGFNKDIIVDYLNCGFNLFSADNYEKYLFQFSFICVSIACARVYTVLQYTFSNILCFNT